MPLRGYDLELIPAVPLPRSVTPQLLTVPGRLAGAVHATGKILDRVRADVLVGFGGYVATPAYLAAKRHNVPIVVHEANPSAGIANRLGAHLTTYVFTGQPDTKLRNAKYLGLPIRPADRRPRPVRARRQGTGALRAPARPAGAARLRRLAGRQVAQPGPGRRRRRDQERRGAGPARHRPEAPRREPAGQAPPGGAASRTWPLPYVDRMDLAYAAADFALAAAGAMTCAELTAVGLPAAYVPLPIGNGEQRLNALPIVQRGGGLLVEDAELTADWIKTSLLPVLTNIDQVAGMSEAAAAMGRKDADRWLAKAVIEIVAAEQASRRPRQPAANPRRPSPPPACRPPRAGEARQAAGAPAGKPVHPAQHQAAAPGGPLSAGERPLPGRQRAGRRMVAARRPGPAGDRARPASSRRSRDGMRAVSSRRRVRRRPAAPRKGSLGRPSARPPGPRRLSPRRLQPPQAQRPQAQPPASPAPPGPGRHRQARLSNCAVT